MKKCILAAIFGALATVFVIVIAAKIQTDCAQTAMTYEHIDYVSNITPEECAVCADSDAVQGSRHWGEDNVGIVNLNTFEVLYLNINPYDESGNMIAQPYDRCPCLCPSGQCFCRCAAFRRKICH